MCSLFICVKIKEINVKISRLKMRLNVLLWPSWDQEWQLTWTDTMKSFLIFCPTLLNQMIVDWTLEQLSVRHNTAEQHHERRPGKWHQHRTPWDQILFYKMWKVLRFSRFVFVLQSFLAFPLMHTHSVCTVSPPRVSGGTSFNGLQLVGGSLPAPAAHCSRGLCEYVEHVCNWCGCLAVCCGLGLARKQTQPAIHALRAAADSSVKYDGVADWPASLSLPWLTSRAADWVCGSSLLFTRKLNESLNPTGADRPVQLDFRRKTF